MPSARRDRSAIYASRLYSRAGSMCVPSGRAERHAHSTGERGVGNGVKHGGKYTVVHARTSMFAQRRRTDAHARIALGKRSAALFPGS